MSTDFKYLVRIAGRDLDGNKKVTAAVADLRGIGHNLSNLLLKLLKIDSRTRIGSLSDREISDIAEAVKNVTKKGVPTWFLNRRNDIGTGTNFHLTGSDLDLMIRSDVEREITTGSWRGTRHMLGLKVRGQRTRTAGRKGRTIGVKKSSLIKSNKKE